MAEYLPRSHRPIAQMFRRTGHWATNLCVRLGISPDAISYLSILAALAAALCFWKSGKNAWLLIIAPLFCYLRLWFNMLDGMVEAAANGCAEPRGLGDVCVAIMPRRVTQFRQADDSRLDMPSNNRGLFANYNRSLETNRDRASR